jgi:hypothetical protein
MVDFMALFDIKKRKGFLKLHKTIYLSSVSISIMIEFNADGSIKVPSSLKKESVKSFETSKVIRITRIAISESPLIDELRIEISPVIEKPERVIDFFEYCKGHFTHMAQLSIKQTGERIYVVKIISGQYRDTWIKSFKDYVGEKFNAQIDYGGSVNDFRKGK